MAKIAHIRYENSEWKVVRYFDLNENGAAEGRIRDANGKTLVEMPVVGQDYGNDKVVAVTEILDDTSTGSKTVTNVTHVVTSSSVTITTTITDKTAQQIDNEVTVEAIERSKEVFGKLHKLELAGIFWLINDVRSRHGQAAITVDQFLTNLNTFASQFDDAKFVTKIKEILNG